MLLNILKIMVNEIKKIIIQFFPPILVNFLRKLRRKEKKITNSSVQSLDIYYSEKMAKILETWGERNAWIEIQHLLLKKEGKILDIACGTGKVIEILNKNKIMNVYGCDISDFLIEKAKKRGIVDEKLKVCDATNLPYDENFFDYSYSIGSLEHFTESQIEMFLKSCKKVTKKISYHQIPMSRSNKDEGWISPLQSYHNNSEKWWFDKCKKVYDKVIILDSSWEDKRSVGKWLILEK